VYRAFENLQPGVTEIHVQPCVDTPEVRALGTASTGWIDDYELIVHDMRLRELINASGAKLIGYRHLREAMRSK
jgi:hypothetical protein